jgi:hypothetical protein
MVAERITVRGRRCEGALRGQVSVIVNWFDSTGEV